MPPKKILLVQLFSNGDCLYATAVARQIKEDNSRCHLTWAVSSVCKTILQNNPFIDEVMEVTTVPKNDVVAFRHFMKQVNKQKKEGRWDEVVVTHIMDRNQANYDGCIRSTIFRGYPFPITVDITPVLRLTQHEKHNAAKFSTEHQLADKGHVILFEYAPQSGQSALTPAEAMRIAEDIAMNERIAVILSSANRVSHYNQRIIDGSVLTIRETAALTHYCSFLVGCSSGISWLSTSDAAKRLPMVQLLNPYTNWINPLSRDFNRFGLNDKELIELTDFDTSKVVECVKEALNDFEAARKKFHAPPGLHFTTTRRIVYNLLCYAQLSAIVKHIRVNKEVYGNNSLFYKELIMGIIEFPFRLLRNFFSKRLLKRFRSS